MATVTAQQLANAAADCQTLETVVNGSASYGPVTTRLGQVLKTTAYLQQQITIQTSDAKNYATATGTFTDSLGNTGQRSSKSYSQDAAASATYIQNNITAINAAPGAATAAQTAATLAQQWASKSDGTTVDGTSYSAYYWAQKASLVAQTGDYVVFSGILTANQAVGTDPIAIGADPKIAARVTFAIGAALQIAGTDFTLGRVTPSDTVTSNLYIVGGTAALAGVAYGGVAQLPTSLTNINAPSSGSVTTTTIQNAAITLAKMAANSVNFACLTSDILATVAQAQAGVATNVLMNPALVLAAISQFTGFTKPPFKSAQFSWTANSRNVKAHTLGVVPTDFQLYLICTVANNGYNVGEVVRLDSYNFTASNYYGQQLSADASNVYITLATSLSMPASTGASFAPSTAQWQMFFVAKV